MEGLVYRTDREYHIERAKKEEEYRRLKKKGGARAAQAAAAAIVDGRAAAAAAAAALKQERQQPIASPAAGGHHASAHVAPLFTNVPRPLSHSSKSQPPPKASVVQSPESSLSPPPFTPQTQKAPVDKGLEVPNTNGVKREAITPPPVSLPNGTDGPPVRPEWLINELARLRTKYSDSIFDVLPKPRPATAAPDAPVEWRVKCADCPGKLYNPGEGDTLNNFEIHLLKNRQHRIKVAERRGVVLPSPPKAPATTLPSATPLPSATTLPPPIQGTPTPSAQVTPSFSAAPVPSPSPSVVHSTSLSAGNISLSPTSITNMPIPSPQPQVEPPPVNPLPEVVVVQEPQEMQMVPEMPLSPQEMQVVPAISLEPQEMQVVPEISLEPQEMQMVPEMSLEPQEMQVVPEIPLEVHETFATDVAPAVIVEPPSVDGPID